MRRTSRSPRSTRAGRWPACARDDSTRCTSPASSCAARSAMGGSRSARSMRCSRAKHRLTPRPRFLPARSRSKRHAFGSRRRKALRPEHSAVRCRAPTTGSSPANSSLHSMAPVCARAARSTSRDRSRPRRFTRCSTPTRGYRSRDASKRAGPSRARRASESSTPPWRCATRATPATSCASAARMASSRCAARRCARRNRRSSR